MPTPITCTMGDFTSNVLTELEVVSELLFVT